MKEFLQPRDPIEAKLVPQHTAASHKSMSSRVNSPPKPVNSTPGQAAILHDKAVNFVLAILATKLA